MWMIRACACTMVLAGALPVLADPPYSVSLDSIKFNHNTASETADGVTIQTSDGTEITAPEWTSSDNDPVAFTMSSSKTIKVSFTCTEANQQDVDIWAEKTGGNRLGDIDTVSVDFSGGSSGKVSFTLSSSCVGSTIREKGTVTWTWKYGSGHTIGQTGPHDIYTLYSSPLSPEGDPRTHILGYACEFADGDATASAASLSIIDGMADHWEYAGNCHLLSSDFVRLMHSIGASAALRRWSAYQISQGATMGQMTSQHTQSVDPVGDHADWPTAELEFPWHQWAEVASGTRDPSFAYTITGKWGAYEDTLYVEYEKCSQAVCNPISHPETTQVNYAGQDTGCEIYPKNAKYNSSPPVSDWFGPP